MSHAIDLERPSVTILEFDRFLEAQRDDTLWELVEGDIVAMTNPSQRHEQIAGNIGAPLKLELRDQGCRVYQGGIRVQSSDDSRGANKPRPDVLVQCGPVHDERNYVTDPLVVVEVLSPSTMDRDRGPNLRFYQTRLRTLRHIALVYQDQMRVEHYRRTENGWDIKVLTAPDDLLGFEAVEFETTLAAVYEGVTFREA
jgi:Uma2 family endonuclease